MQLLMSGGTVVTADPALPLADAVLVTDDEITAVGTLEHCRSLAADDAELVDLAGGVVLPGFVDGHAHLLMTGSALSMAQLRTATTLEEIRRRLVEWAEAHPESPYVLGTSFLFDAVPGNEPTRQMLDDLFPDRPVFIDSFDLHCGWVNTAALEILEITDDTPDPIGGEIRRDPSTGTATGYLLETALHEHMWAFLARVDDATRDAHLQVAIRALNESGTTTAVDMAVDADGRHVRARRGTTR
ncbi:MAG: amidohydrolase family protein [Ilumatobacteraceae bacterium]